MAVLLFLLGSVAGILSGFFGIGGGVVIVPALALVFKESISKASYISLITMSYPVFLLALWQAWQKGLIQMGDIKKGGLIALGLASGAIVGRWLALSVGELWLKKAFGVFLILIGIRMLI